MDGLYFNDVVFDAGSKPIHLPAAFFRTMWLSVHQGRLKFILRGIRKEYKWCDKRNAYKWRSFYAFNHRDLGHDSGTYIKRITTKTDRKNMTTPGKALQLLINQPNYVQTPQRYKYSSGKNNVTGYK